MPRSWKRGFIVLISFQSSLSSFYRGTPLLGLPQTYVTATAACYGTANWWDFVEFFPCASSKPCHRAVEQPLVTHVERIGRVLFPVACSAVAANHSSEKSWQTTQNSLIKNGEMKWPALKAKNHLLYIPPWINHMGHTPPWILQLRRMLQWRERDGMVSVRLWVKIHLHHWLAATWAQLLMCAKHCGRPKQHWCHDDWGVAVVSL